MSHWHPTPPNYPGRCILTSYSKAENGPYVEVGEAFIGDPNDPTRNPKKGSIYLSKAGVEELVNNYFDSPLRAIAAKEVQRINEELVRLGAELEAAEREIDDRDSEIQELHARLQDQPEPATIPEDLADDLALRLSGIFDERYAKKTGPKARK